MTVTSQLDEPIDGRTARAVRTRDALVDACLALIDDGDLRPTGPRIAARAGVSVRSVFQHFDDLESLFSAVGARVRERLAAIAVPIDSTAPHHERLAAFVDQRAQLLEAVTPVLRASLVHAGTSAAITRQYQHGHGLFRRQIDEAFAVELAAAPQPVRLHDALMVAASWPSWNMLRAAEGRSVSEARASMAWALRAAFGATDGAAASGLLDRGEVPS